MAAVQPTTPGTMISGQITVTGATATGTLIFDAAIGEGNSYTYEVIVTNVDADAGDDLYLGSSATLATVALGTPIGIYIEAANVSRSWIIKVPPFGKLYANCTNGETRDVRVFATPMV
jgi:hypothetical protein